MPCSGFPDETCGGRYRLSVYAITGKGALAAGLSASAKSAAALKTPVSKNFVGCYADVWDPWTPVTSAFAKRSSQNMTVGKCRAFCLERGQKLFALENGNE